MTGDYSQNASGACLKVAGSLSQDQRASTEQHIERAVAFDYCDDPQRAIQGRQGSMLVSQWCKKDTDSA